MGKVNPVNTDVIEPFIVVHHWVLVDSTVMEVHPWMEMNTVDVDERCSFLVVNAHMGEVNPINTDVVEPFMMVHHWVLLDSAVM
jgi:hypothetical protein